jgi:dethiobiotin synthetase
MKNTIFITGTDTNIGKTFVACMLLKAFNKAGANTLALKPVASGCYKNKQGDLRNDDAVQLQRKRRSNDVPLP